MQESISIRDQRPPVVLLGGGPIAVPVARSLAGAQVFVYALGHYLDPVRASRACGRFIDLGAGEGVSDRWLDWLDGRNAAGAVVFACNDDGLELVANHRSVLTERGYRFIPTNDDVVLAMLDKLRTYELAQAAGVRSPRHVVMGPDDDVGGVGAAFGFPLALKPRHSHLFTRVFGLRRKAFVVNDHAELEAAHDELRRFQFDVLVTEIVPGPEDTYRSYYTYVDPAGEPLFDLSKRKLRQFLPGFGLATAHVIERDERTIELGRQFVTGVGIRGLACVEFKEDVRDGELTLIECNSRFTAGYELVRHAGIDLGLLAYNRVVGLPDPPLLHYRTGVRMWHPIEDVRGFLAYRRRGELTFGRWLRSVLHRQHFPMFSWQDPLPTVFSLSRFVWRPFVSRRLIGTSRSPEVDVSRTSAPAVEVVDAAPDPTSAATTASATSEVLAAADSARSRRKS
jgi:D-aspartate ligase